MTIEFATGLYFHREGPGLLFGTGAPSRARPAWLEAAAPQIARRVPALADAPIAGGWSGLYEMTPDHNALIGEAPAPSRFLYATGFSGHGFQQAPAVGEIVRDLYLGRRPVRRRRAARRGPRGAPRAQRRLGLPNHGRARHRLRRLHRLPPHRAPARGRPRGRRRRLPHAVLRPARKRARSTPARPSTASSSAASTSPRSARRAARRRRRRLPPRRRAGRAPELRRPGALPAQQRHRDPAPARGRRPSPLDAFVYASSSSVYGDGAAPRRMREDDPPAPLSPYATPRSRSSGSPTPRRDHGVPTVGLRFFSVYGPRQRPGHGFQRFLARAARGGPWSSSATARSAATSPTSATPSTPRSPPRAARPGAVYNVGGGQPASLSRGLALLGELLERELTVELPAPAPGDPHAPRPTPPAPAATSASPPAASSPRRRAAARLAARRAAREDACLIGRPARRRPVGPGSPRVKRWPPRWPATGPSPSGFEALLERLELRASAAGSLSPKFAKWSRTCGSCRFHSSGSTAAARPALGRDVEPVDLDASPPPARGRSASRPPRPRRRSDGTPTPARGCSRRSPARGTCRRRPCGTS